MKILQGYKVVHKTRSGYCSVIASAAAVNYPLSKWVYAEIGPLFVFTDWSRAKNFADTVILGDNMATLTVSYVPFGKSLFRVLDGSVVVNKSPEKILSIWRHGSLDVPDDWKMLCPPYSALALAVYLGDDPGPPDTDRIKQLQSKFKVSL